MKYTVLVKFRRDFIEASGRTITVGVRARPEKGRANAELIKKIAAHFRVPRVSVRIVVGAGAKRKIVEVD